MTILHPPVRCEYTTTLVSRDHKPQVEFQCTFTFHDARILQHMRDRVTAEVEAMLLRLSTNQLRTEQMLADIITGLTARMDALEARQNAQAQAEAMLDWPPDPNQRLN